MSVWPKIPKLADIFFCTTKSYYFRAVETRTGKYAVMIKKFRLWDNILGWTVFAIAAVTYLLTIEPTTSLWDCGEFIASSYKLEVGHPPGAPFFMLLARFFANFAGGDVSKVAMMVNAMSGLASALTILFLFWTITHLARRILLRQDSDFTAGRVIAVLGAGLTGILLMPSVVLVSRGARSMPPHHLPLLFLGIIRWEDCGRTSRR
jgi:hypothetical protein